LQNSGKLSELSLTDILETVQTERATGTLRVSNGDNNQATLYFLFGHLFHAENGEARGEQVVFDALGWGDGDFSFDAKAKLPAEETIKVSTAEILAAHGSGGGNGVAPAAASAETDEVGEEEEPAESPTAEVAAAPGDTDTSKRSREMRRRATDKRPETRPPESMELYPVPRGNLIYESLTASFVDFPKVLRSLGKDAHNGYVRLTGEGFNGVLLFATGEVVEAIYDGSHGVDTGKAAFDAFANHIDNGEGVLDVIQLDPEMVTAIFQLLTSPSIYDRLLARFVKPDALLEHLGEQQTSGAMIVRSQAEAGIVLLRDGAILGAYTDGSRDVDTKPDKVLALCENPKAEIEVRGGEVPQSLPVMATGAAIAGGNPAAAAPAPTAPNPAVERRAKAPAAAPAAAPAPAPVAAKAPAPDGAAKVDWADLIDQMAGKADEVLGTRSKKVKELLYASNHSREDVEGTLDRISELSIMFVDPSKLSALADDMRRIAESAA
jgi:hypothetical protein